MQNNTDKIIAYFQNHGGIARFSSIVKAGFHPDVLKGLERKGRVERIAWGLYRLTSSSLSPHPDFIITCLQAPKGVICLLSALSFHEATNEIPRSVNIAIPYGARANKIIYPPVKFYRFSPKAWKAGVEEHEIGGHRIRIYSLAKTIADCFKFRNKIGVDIARDALKTSIAEKGIKPTEIINFAKICRVDRIIKPILETIL
jgi:predicted transcriptional regulator of viral defense system